MVSHEVATTDPPAPKIRRAWRNPHFPPDFDNFPVGTVHCSVCGKKLTQRRPLSGRPYFCAAHNAESAKWYNQQYAAGNVYDLDEDGYPVLPAHWDEAPEYEGVSA